MLADYQKNLILEEFSMKSEYIRFITATKKQQQWNESTCGKKFRPHPNAVINRNSGDKKKLGQKKFMWKCRNVHMVAAQSAPLPMSATDSFIKDASCFCLGA